MKKRGRKPNMEKRNRAKELKAKGLSYREVGKLMGIKDVKTIWRYVHSNPVEDDYRSVSFAYKVLYEKYGSEVYKEGFEGREFVREMIRRYFKNTCEKCGKKWIKGQRRFDVHHKNDNGKSTKKYDSDIDLEKVSLLCHKCHLNLPEHIKKFSEVQKNKVNNVGEKESNCA